jgi:DNA-binding transcriptional regulator YiaG
MLKKERLELVYIAPTEWNLVKQHPSMSMRVAYFALLSSSKTIESETIESARERSGFIA